MDKLFEKQAAGGKPLTAATLLLGLGPTAVWGTAAYFCSLISLPFGSQPFGVALLAASNKSALGVCLGLLVSALLEGSILKGGIYTALFLLRILLRLTLDNPFPRGKKPSLSRLLSSLFGEAVTYRVLSALVAAFLLGAAKAIGGGLLYYDIFGLVISCAVAPASALVFSLYFTRSGTAAHIGFLAISAASIYGVRELSVYGVSLAMLCALFVTFEVTRRQGSGFGAVTGLAVGLVYSPIISPIFVFSAVILGLFIKISPTLALFASFFLGSAWCLYIKGIYALNGPIGGLLCACLLYSVWHRLFNVRAVTAEKKSPPLCRVPRESELDGIRLYDINRRMSVISDCLSSLAAFFEEIKLRYPRRSELLRICNDALCSSCSGCPMSEGCREKEHIENEAGRLSLILEKNKRLSASDFDAELVKSCSRLPDILDEINYNSGLRLYGGSHREPDRDGIFAPDYKALSRLLEHSLETDTREYLPDRELSERLCSPLDALELGIQSAAVYGRRRRNVALRSSNIHGLLEHRSEIFDLLCRLLPFPLEEDSINIRKCSGEGALYSVSEKSRLSVSYTYRQRCAKGEDSFCGDSISLFENRDNRFFSLISDGMGSGREAAAVSEICVRFLEQMLTLGGMSRELLSMLGGMLFGRCEGSLTECSATVDLLELDLISGDASIYKSGAAPSYIYRGGKLFKLRSRTMPIGILCDSEAKRTDLRLCAGDTVVMVSDGVCTNDEDCPWLFDLLRKNIDSSTPDRLAELIVKYSVGHGSEDDISVCVVSLG